MGGRAPAGGIVRREGRQPAAAQPGISRELIRHAQGKDRWVGSGGQAPLDHDPAPIRRPAFTVQAAIHAQAVKGLRADGVLFRLAWKAAEPGVTHLDRPAAARANAGFIFDPRVSQVFSQGELEGQIEASGVQAGFIKLSAGDDGLTACEIKILRAAARAAAVTGAAIGSHTIRGRVVRDQLDIVEACGCPTERFIWIHAMVEPDIELNLEMARRGAWIEYDNIGQEGTDASLLHRIQRMLDAGLGDQVLLSHDRGWYDPAQPGGGTPKPFTYLGEQFLPRLRTAGVDEATLCKMTCENPFRALAR